MQELITGVITQAALAAGLPAGRVISQVKKDNLTLERPRLELQFLPESLTRTGRKLGLWRSGAEQIRKRELYQVELEVAANALAEDAAWLGEFCYSFMAALPRGFNDKRGNWVAARAQKATFGKAPDKRVGDSVIEVFSKVSELILLGFVWRITGEEAEALVQGFTLDMHFKQEAHHGQGKGNGGQSRH